MPSEHVPQVTRPHAVWAATLRYGQKRRILNLLPAIHGCHRGSLAESSRLPGAEQEEGRR
jgi:hypothetical protein